MNKKAVFCIYFVLWVFALFGLMSTIVFVCEPFYIVQIIQNTEFRLNSSEEANYIQESASIDLSWDFSETTIPSHTSKTLFIPIKMLSSPLYLEVTQNSGSFMIFNYSSQYSSLFSPQKYLRISNGVLSSSNCLLLHNLNTNIKISNPNNCQIIPTYKWLISQKSKWMIFIIQGDKEVKLKIFK